MNNFTINGQLTSDKKLTLTQNCCLSAGENMSTLLHIDIPAEYSQCSYQIEFECPDNYTYTTPKLTVNNQQSQYYIEYTLESCILQNAGQIKVQVLVRQYTDDSILFKSTLSSGSTLQISASVNDKGQSYAKQDFFATAYTTMDKLLDFNNQLDENQQALEQIHKRCDDFLNDYQRKLDSGELRGPTGANISSIVETGKDLEGNSIYTVTMSDGQTFTFTVPAGKQGEKGDKGDKGDPGDVSSIGTYPNLTAGKAQADENGNNIAQTYAPKNTICRPNILINGNFKINQRGKTSYVGSNNYTVDRWKTNALNSFVNVLDNGISCGISGVTTASNRICIEQVIDDWQSYLGKTLTLSVYYDNVVEDIGKTVSVRLDFGNSEQNTPLRTSSNYATLTALVPNNATQLVVQIRGYNAALNYSLTLKGIKLEEGDFATPLLEPDIATELLKCKRYFNIIGSSGNFRPLATGYLYTNEMARIFLQYDEMRAIPTIKFEGAFRVVSNFATTVTLTLINTTNTTANIDAQLLNSKIEGYGVQLQTDSGGGQIILDAEI